MPDLILAHDGSTTDLHDPSCWEVVTPEQADAALADGRWVVDAAFGPAGGMIIDYDQPHPEDAIRGL